MKIKTVSIINDNSCPGHSLFKKIELGVTIQSNNGKLYNLWLTEDKLSALGISTKDALEIVDELLIMQGEKPMPNRL